MNDKTLLSIYFSLLLVTIIVGIYHFWVSPIDLLPLIILGSINVIFNTFILFIYFFEGKGIK